MNDIQALNDAKCPQISLHSEEFARWADENDEMRHFQAKFHFPRAPNGSDAAIYLCGNSLGLQPTTTRAYVEEELKKWQDLGVEGHFASTRPWVTVDETCTEMMAKVVGAKTVEVALMNTLTVNLHLMMAAFYRPTATRNKILVEAKAFPSDNHAVMSQILHHGFNVEECFVLLHPREGEHLIRVEDIETVIETQGECIALIMISGIQYYTGQFFPLQRITELAHGKGCKVGFDLAHAVGNVPLELHEWGPDFAVWCSYKYLNSGPGGIGGCFVHERHANASIKDLPRLAGWWGHRKEDRFLMSPEFIPSPGAFGFQLSNPSVLCLATLRASLDIFEEASVSKLREKSILLTGYLEALLAHFLPHTVSILTPSTVAHRGCQLSLVFNECVEKVHELITQRGVICDMRKPNVMRIAPCPLYNSFTDVFRFVVILKECIETMDGGPN